MRLVSLFPTEPDKQFVLDFFVHVIFGGRRDLQCNGDCERNIEVGIETAS